MRGIAIFGSSEPDEGHPLYAAARRLGRLVADRGAAVVTGGYGGVMEAASRGAREAGGRAIGVCCCQVFRTRQPNRWLSETHEAADLHERTRRLVELSSAFVVLPGGAGTLAELTMLWALERAGCLGPRPVVLWGDAYRELVDFLVRQQMLEQAPARRVIIARGPEDVLAQIDRRSAP